MGNSTIGLAARIRSKGAFIAHGACFQLAEGLDHLRERGLADFALEFLLHAVKRGDHANGAALALRLEREKISACIVGVDPAQQQALGLKR